MATYLGLKGDGASRCNRALGRRRQLQGRERLDRQGRVIRGTALDERRGQREHLIEREGRVERLREGRLAEPRAQVRRVAGLDGEDGARGGQVRLLHDERRGAEVRRHADALEDGGRGEEALDVGVAEIVGAFLDGRGTSSCAFECQSF